MINSFSRSAVIFLLIVMASACTSIGDIPTLEYTKDQVDMPAVSVFRMTPSQRNMDACKDYARKSILHHCEINLIDTGLINHAFSSSGRFQQVRYADKEVPYSIRVMTASYRYESGEDLGHAALAGATLLLAPMQLSTDIQAVVEIFWHDFPVKRYEYDIPIKIKAGLLNITKVADSEALIAESIVSHFMVDAEKDNVFSTKTLSAALDSTDYDAVYIEPDLGDQYELRGSYIYRDPHLGVQTRYHSAIDAEEYYDVFIYPIAHWDLSDQQSLLDQEMDNLKRDIEFSLKERQATEYQLLSQQVKSEQLANRVARVGYLAASYRAANEAVYKTETYVTIVKDKFIKSRVTYQPIGSVFPDAWMFSKVYMNKVTVPSESTYMAKIRHQWRSKMGLMR